MEGRRPLDWRRELGFSQRLTATSNISKAYRSANGDCASAIATKAAKVLEEDCRKNAASLAEYHELIGKKIHSLLATINDGDSHERNTLEEVVPESSTPGIQLGRYYNAQHHANGLFSEVFTAAPPDGPAYMRVALKVTTPDMMSAPHDSKREARILLAAKGPNVIDLMETFQQPGGRLVLVFPFVPYELGSVLTPPTEPGFPNDAMRHDFLHDIFSALAHIHGLGIIHRDVKPSNLLLASLSSPVYLADFGIAWSPTDVASEPADEKVLDVGTTCYRPPELLFGHQAYGTELDMWAAGCVAAQVVGLGKKTLFDAGDLGSELALIKSIFETLGTPDLDLWPEAADFPDWGKMNFTQYPGKSWQGILPSADPKGVDLVSKLVVYESGERLSAAEALNHPYFDEKRTSG